MTEITDEPKPWQRYLLYMSILSMVCGASLMIASINEWMHNLNEGLQPLLQNPIPRLRRKLTISQALTIVLGMPRERFELFAIGSVILNISGFIALIAAHAQKVERMFSWWFGVFVLNIPIITFAVSRNNIIEAIKRKDRDFVDSDHQGNYYTVGIVFASVMLVPTLWMLKLGTKNLWLSGFVKLMLLIFLIVILTTSNMMAQILADGNDIVPRCNHTLILSFTILLVSCLVGFISK